MNPGFRAPSILLPQTQESGPPAPPPPAPGVRVRSSVPRTPGLTTVAMMHTNRQYPNGNGNALGTRRSGPSRLPGPPKMSVVPHKYANSPCKGETSLLRPKLLGGFPRPSGSSSFYPSLLAEADCKILSTSLSKQHTSPTLPSLLLPPTSLPRNFGGLKLQMGRAEGQSASSATAKAVSGRSESQAVHQ